MIAYCDAYVDRVLLSQAVLKTSAIERDLPKTCYLGPFSSPPLTHGSSTCPRYCSQEYTEQFVETCKRGSIEVYTDDNDCCLTDQQTAYQNKFYYLIHCAQDFNRIHINVNKNYKTQIGLGKYWSVPVGLTAIKPINSLTVKSVHSIRTLRAQVKISQNC